MQDILERISQTRVIPVVKINDASKVVKLTDALVAGGLPVIEITFRTEAASEAIRKVARDRPDVLLGAGTVLNPEQAEQAVDAGARFILSPGLDEATVKFCQQKGVLFFPGVCTPSEIQKALSFGLNMMKYFPAGAMGGLKTIRAIAAPFGDSVKFIPTGGINRENLAEYLKDTSVLACGGTWIAKSSMIDKGEFEAIARNAKESMELVKSLKSAV